KLDVVKDEMARLNIEILGISELRWTGMGHFTSESHQIFYCGQKSCRRHGADLRVNKRVSKTVLGLTQEMISIRLQGKPINITVIHGTDAEEKKVEQFYGGLQQLLDITSIKDIIFIIRLYTLISPDGQCRNQYILCRQRWKSCIKSEKTRPRADCGSDHQLLITKFRIKLNKTGKAIR
uniref:Uncharacterized protein n=1 Tax=Lepisosteus oculatus TaxID=7918 RepID=W5NL39_LEPOC